MCPPDLATKFARGVCVGVGLARSKRKHMTSGVRLPKHLAAIVAQLDKPFDLGAKAELARPICDVVELCRTKKRNMSSGAKTF